MFSFTPLVELLAGGVVGDVGRMGETAGRHITVIALEICLQCFVQVVFVGHQLLHVGIVGAPETAEIGEYRLFILFHRFVFDTLEQHIGGLHLVGVSQFAPQAYLRSKGADECLNAIALGQVVTRGFDECLKGTCQFSRSQSVVVGTIVVQLFHGDFLSASRAYI